MFRTGHRPFTPIPARYWPLLTAPHVALPPWRRGGLSASRGLQHFQTLDIRMDMAKPKTPEAKRRNAQTAAMLTSRERAAVDRYGQRHGMTRSQAARYLMLKALAELDTTFTPDEG